MNQTETLDRLNKEKSYEDKLAEDLSNYFLVSVASLNGLNEDEKAKCKKHLEKIMFESRKHAYMFDQLIQKVFESGNDSF
jgi:hypothetical protein